MQFRMDSNFDKEVKDFLENFDIIEDGTLQHMVHTLMLGCENIVGTAMPISPHKYGRLESSGFVFFNHENNKVAEVGGGTTIRGQNYQNLYKQVMNKNIIEAGAGFDVNYAAKMEEHKGGFSDPRAKHQFFSTTFEREGPKIFDKIQFDIKGKLNM